MAEGDGQVYQSFVYELLNKTLDLSSGGDTLKVILVTGYTPSIHAHTSYTETAITSVEVTGTGYTAGGKTLASQTVTEQGTAGASKARFDANNVTWTGLNIGDTSGAPSQPRRCAQTSK